MNKEFLKGIEAREKLHILKQISKLDSIQLSLYKDSVVPNMQKGIDTAKLEIVRLEGKLSKAESLLGVFQYTSIALFILTLGLIL